MLEALSFLKHFEEPELDWLLEQASELQVISSTILIEEGTVPNALSIIIQGLVGVQVGANQMAQLGPGELFGEISLLENSPATATVKAIENTLLLVIPRELVARHLGENVRFAAQWYRAIALIQSKRLRERVTRLTEQLRFTRELAEPADAAWQPTLCALKDFKALMRDLDQQAIKQGAVDESLRGSSCAQVNAFLVHLNAQIGEASGLPEHLREEIGARVGVELLPFVLLTATAERFYSKPRGYAGDFMTIELIYQNRPDGSQRIGPLMDYFFLETPAAKAVRNRRGLLAREIGRTCESRASGPVRICTLACGPAAEVFDVLASRPWGERLQATLVDIDAQALEFVRNKATQMGLLDRLRLVEGNLVYLAAGRQKIPDLAPQDLVYSIGLIDYFNDKWVVHLLDYIHSLLRPGGRVILGNFHSANSTKAFMDHVLDWKLVHRTEEDMHRLFARSRFARGCTNIWFEEERVNLFAECVKTPLESSEAAPS